MIFKITKPDIETSIVPIEDLVVSKLSKFPTRNENQLGEERQIALHLGEDKSLKQAR